MQVLLNSKKLRVLRYGRTKLTEFRAGTKNAVPVPRVLWHGAYRACRSSGYGYECPTKLTEVPGTGMNVLHNLQKFRVLGHGRTELTDVLSRVLPGVNDPGMVLYVPYRSQPWNVLLKRPSWGAGNHTSPLWCLVVTRVQRLYLGNFFVFFSKCTIK